ncbi:MAG TPA: inositol-3-phosphate synthase, partial [Planctomycetaceae bacterium]|nr:inositol-3-phosphate synthase [Planctomycetaceae bacterium]
MAQRKVGVWLVGAWGGVATTVVVGIMALRRGLTEPTALVSALPPLAGLDLAGFDELVIGGHEIRETTYRAEADVLHKKSRVFSPEWWPHIEADLAAADAEVRPGTLHNVGATIDSLAGPKTNAFRGESAGQAVTRLAADIKSFKDRLKLDRVIVVNVSSTEPPVDASVKELPWTEIDKQLSTNGPCALPASTLYAIAAFREKAAYV